MYLLVLDLSLYDLCAVLSSKTPTVDSVVNTEKGSEQEAALAMHMRMRGRKFKSEKMTLDVSAAEKKAARSIGRQLMSIGLGGDDGTMASVILERLRTYCSVYNDSNMVYILRDMEVP